MEKMSKKDFNEFRFNGLNYRQVTNKYVTMNRVSEDGNKIVVKVADSHLLETRYGYALILDQHHVVFVKDWQVSKNYYGNEVVLDRNYWTVKEWGDFDEFFDDETQYSFDEWKKVAEEQDEKDEDGTRINPVKWESHGKVAPFDC